VSEGPFKAVLADGAAVLLLLAAAMVGGPV